MQDYVHQTIGVLGGTSPVGRSVLRQLQTTDQNVVLFSRRTQRHQNGKVEWRQLHPIFNPNTFDHQPIAQWICLAPIWVLSDYFSLLAAYGIQRIVVVSSTSRFTKEDSDDLGEQEVAQRLVHGEQKLQQWATETGVEWIILRPTLIYGLGADKNISEIIRFVRSFGFFPLFGRGSGLRQPVHVDDVALASLAALATPKLTNRAYNISGGETLTYREMVSRVFGALNRRLLILTVPLWTFELALCLIRIIPRYRKWTSAMAKRMNRDMVFDDSDARRDFGFKPRPFLLSQNDLPH